MRVGCLGYPRLELSKGKKVFWKEAQHYAYMKDGKKTMWPSTTQYYMLREWLFPDIILAKGRKPLRGANYGGEEDQRGRVALLRCIDMNWE